MQRYVGYNLDREIIFDRDMKYDYSPRYYGMDRFSEEQRIQQGYQPYFNSQSA